MIEYDNTKLELAGDEIELIDGGVIEVTGQGVASVLRWTIIDYVLLQKDGVRWIGGARRGSCSRWPRVSRTRLRVSQHCFT